MRRHASLFMALMGVLAGTSAPDVPGSARQRRPPAPQPKRGESTSSLVVCMHCGAECGPGKGCSAKAQALLIGYRKLNEQSFECPGCRKP
jgi:hypothetical protein